MNKELFDLKDINWGEFKIGDIFNVENSKAYHKTNLKKTLEGIAYVSRTNLDNGLDCIVLNENFKDNPKNTIVFGAENANFFFQPFNYITGNKMYFIAEKKLNKYNSLFIKLMLEYSIKHSGFGYGKGLTGNRLKRRSILLPITESELPDWDFMESYMKTKENFFLTKYKSYLEKKLNQININKEELDVINISTKRWNEFFISDIGEIESGVYVYGYQRIEGDTPYVAAKSKDNGVGDFIGNENKTLESNCISINRNGSIGYTFYHPYKAVFSYDCRKLLLNNHKNNKYISLFISNQVASQRGKYGYGYKMGTERLIRQKIMLPIDADGTPDWDFMESYMKRLEYEKISKYLNYIENRIK